jgi:hypothetical protein
MSRATFHACEWVNNSVNSTLLLYRKVIADLVGCSFTRNVADVGGAITVQGGWLRLVANTTFADNKAVFGGAIFLDGRLCIEGQGFDTPPACDVVLDRVRIINNTATAGERTHRARASLPSHARTMPGEQTSK